MRVKAVLKNSYYSIASYSIIFIIGLFSRKVFLSYFSTELLGYEGIFNNIFSLLSLTEMGVTSSITYNLYKEIANKNEFEISKLMQLYKLVFRGVGVFSILIGITIFPFLKYIIKDNILNWNFIYYIYSLQLFALILNYFLSYKRILFVVSQMEYECVKSDLVINSFANIIKIIIIILTRNYLIYLTISILQNFLANFYISIKYNRKFVINKKIRISNDDLKKWNIFKDIKNLTFHKIAGFVYGSTDNIVISIILGINSVGLFANYLMIVSQVNNVFRKITNTLIPSIGNLIYSNNMKINDQRKFFDSLDLLFFFISSFVFIAFFVLFQIFIELWIGSKYLLPVSFVFFLSLNTYVSWTQATVEYYRNAYGEYEFDRFYMILSALTNLVFSIALSYYFGITGIMVGTVIGHLFIWYGRIKVVFKLFLKTTYKQYLINQFCQIVLVLVELGIVYYIACIFPVSLLGLILRIMLVILLPNVINFIIFYKSERFFLIKKYFLISFKILKETFSKKKILE